MYFKTTPSALFGPFQGMLHEVTANPLSEIGPFDHCKTIVNQRLLVRVLLATPTKELDLLCDLARKESVIGNHFVVVPRDKSAPAIVFDGLPINGFELLAATVGVEPIQT